MWSDLNDIWKESLSLAWESFNKNTIPIGAVIVDSEDRIVSRGRNRIYDVESKNPLAGTYMAHAEMTAMINLKEKEHPDIKKYTLYMAYIRNKKINIQSSSSELEVFQICIQASY